MTRFFFAMLSFLFVVHPLLVHAQDAIPASADETTAREFFSQAEQAEAAGNSDKAIEAYRRVTRNHAGSSVAPKAQLKIAQLLEASGSYDKAFDAFGEYITKFPRGDDFDGAVQAQFRIAKMYLDGERQKLLGLKTFPSMQRAQEMFESILKNAPFSKIASLAQFYVGQALEKQGKTAEALVAYEAAIARYPGDPVAGDAQFQIGYVYLNSYRSGSYDPSVAQKAREAFDDFIIRYPNNEKVPQAKENLTLLSGNETKGALNIAKFYDKTKNYKAAVIYYNEVIRQQPGSPEAEESKKRIDELVNIVGEDALRPGPERTETGERARARRRLQAQVDTSARPDFNGPPMAIVPDEVAPSKPRLRTSGGSSRSRGGDNSAPAEYVPPVEPALPAAEDVAPNPIP